MVVCLMVKKIVTQGNKYYQCEECKLLYNDKVHADECEKWCKEHDSCNLEITSHALKAN